VFGVPVEDIWKLIKITSRYAFAVAARSSYDGFESSFRVITTRNPSRSNANFEIRAISRTKSFSTTPLCPRAPLSVPPCAGSSTITGPLWTGGCGAACVGAACCGALCCAGRLDGAWACCGEDCTATGAVRRPECGVAFRTKTLATKRNAKNRIGFRTPKRIAEMTKCAVAKKGIR